MALLLAAMGVLLAGALGALVARTPRAATAVGAGSAIAGALLGLVPAVHVLVGGQASTMNAAWDVPYGAFRVELDALSALFLLPVFGLPALAALYGSEYLRAHHGRRALGPPWCFFNLLVASMALVVVARNGVLFLVAWEVMALASFFLVTFDDHEAAVRDAGWTYLVASHLGTTFLLVLFVLLGRTSGSLDFDRLGPGLLGAPGLLFVLALIGFGTKAGLVPIHVWLPEAHPAAPSHVSAVLSGAMIKMGIYGLVRTLCLLGPLPAWCGWLLVGTGIASGLVGVLFALAQQDLKRVLAYSSVENSGLIALGLGLGLVGAHAGNHVLAVLGIAAALLHVLNHALFKGLLFLAAGAVVHATGTRRMEALGGLLRTMPRTGLAFLVGAVAICGLPPLNGFASELLLFLAALRGILGDAGASPAIAALAGLALIGGLAAACFTRAAGVVFLGVPRTAGARAAHDPGPAMRGAILALAAACVLAGLLAPLLVIALAVPVETVTGLPLATVHRALAGAGSALGATTAGGFALALAVAALAVLRVRLLRGRRIASAPTWNCGYAAPSARMQYTASSFAQPLTALFAVVLRTRTTVARPVGFFPDAAVLRTDTPDLWREAVYRPAFGAIGRGVAALRWLQHGRVQLYVLYVGLTLLVLLVWKLG